MYIIFFVNNSDLGVLLCPSTFKILFKKKLIFISNKRAYLPANKGQIISIAEAKSIAVRCSLSFKLKSGSNSNNLSKTFP